MKVLLIGGSGQLGAQILTRWRDDDVTAPSHADLDLADSASIAAQLERYRPDLLVNCAAFHNVDLCETESARAFEINALAVDRAAALCAQHDVEFATISTDYVFDGSATQPYTEADCPRPISAYGASKLAGELLVLRRRTKAYVVRTCGIYGLAPSRSKGHTFVDRVIAQARAGERPRIVQDVIASPTYAGHLATALRALVRAKAYGLSHACNAGAVSWYDFAVAAIELAGLTPGVEAISAAQWSAPARRPAFSALANARLGSLGITLPTWREGIAAYLADKGG